MSEKTPKVTFDGLGIAVLGNHRAFVDTNRAGRILAMRVDGQSREIRPDETIGSAHDRLAAELVALDAADAGPEVDDATRAARARAHARQGLSREALALACSRCGAESLVWCRKNVGGEKFPRFARTTDLHDERYDAAERVRQNIAARASEDERHPAPVVAPTPPAWARPDDQRDAA